jgi:hypothetical protein
VARHLGPRVGVEGPVPGEPAGAHEQHVADLDGRALVLEAADEVVGGDRIAGSLVQRPPDAVTPPEASPASSSLTGYPPSGTAMKSS